MLDILTSNPDVVLEESIPDDKERYTVSFIDREREERKGERGGRGREEGGKGRWSSTFVLSNESAEVTVFQYACLTPPPPPVGLVIMLT